MVHERTHEAACMREDKAICHQFPIKSGYACNGFWMRFQGINKSFESIDHFLQHESEIETIYFFCFEKQLFSENYPEKKKRDGFFIGKWVFLLRNHWLSDPYTILFHHLLSYQLNYYILMVKFCFWFPNICSSIISCYNIIFELAGACVISISSKC